MQVRPFQKEDVPALKDAIDRDPFHPGEWRVDHFFNEEKGETPKGMAVSVIEDDKGPVSFVRYTSTLRISCVWNDTEDTRRNARAIVEGLKHAIATAKQAGYNEIIIHTKYDKLATFFENVVKMERSGNEYLLYV